MSAARNSRTETAVVLGVRAVVGTITGIAAAVLWVERRWARQR